MPVTRSGNKSSASSVGKSSSKRAAEPGSSPSAKRGKKQKKGKDQKTIEQTMNIEDGEDEKKMTTENENEQEKNKEVEVEQNGKNGATESENEQEKDKKGNVEQEEKPDFEMTDVRNVDHEATNGTKQKEEQEPGRGAKQKSTGEAKAAELKVEKGGKDKEAQKTEQGITNSDSVVEDPKREAAMPSSILEKGIIYFFFRGRVNVEEPESVDDVARSYVVLRPLPIGAKLGEGPLEDMGNARLLALPKKFLPKSHRDRFLAFVEKPKTSVKELKEKFIAGSDYETKTAGTRHTPAATPIAEGVYAITSTGRESHLAYHITNPKPLGEVQKSFGINERGSYVVTVKNPTVSAPRNVSLPKGAEYPEHTMKKFRDLRWMPLEPELLDYENTQFLLIGEGSGYDKAIQEQDDDRENGNKETPAEEMAKLEDEDQIRVEHLKDDDPIFADLGLSSEEYRKMPTTW